MNGNHTMLAEIDLSSAERDQVSALIERAKSNVHQAQQMAVDASRLLRKTDQNLAEIEGTGFFKRLWHANTGKHAQVMRATQADLIQMQKIAFGYLVALQEQNLIQAHAIAVIRNNLDDLAESVVDTIDNVSRLVDAFQRRVGQIEDVIECHDWLHNLPMTDYSLMRPASRALHITIDYVRRMHEAGIRFDRIEHRNDLALAFKKEGINSQTPYALENIFGEVADDDGMSAHEFTLLTGSLRGVTVHLVEERVPSLAAHALLRFAAAYPQIEGAKEVLDFQTAVHAVPAMVSRAIPSPLTMYTLLSYATELAAALFFALEVAIPAAESERTGQLPPIAQVAAPIDISPVAFSIDDLIGNLIPITRHAYLGTTPSSDDRKRYLESFAIVLSSTGAFTTEQRNYLTSLGEAYGEPDVARNVETWLLDVRNLPLKELLSFIRQGEVIHAWLTDAVFLWTLGDRANRAGRTTIETMAKAMNLPIDFTKDFIDNAETVATAPTSDALLSAIVGMSEDTTSWKTLVDYRKLSFRGAFKRHRKDLHNDAMEYARISIEMSKLQMNMMGLDPWGDESLLRRAGMNVARRMIVSDFDGIKERARKCGLDGERATYAGRPIMSAFGSEKLPETPNMWGVSADENVDLDNKEWLTNMQKACDEIDRYLSAVSALQDAVSNALWQIEEGNW